jgi:hypothetical protein
VEAKALSAQMVEKALENAKNPASPCIRWIRTTDSRCFTATPTEGYPRGGEFVSRLSPRSET